MRWQCVVLAFLVQAVLTASASAGIIFNRHPKPTFNPAQRVQQLLVTLRSDPDENKRETAVEGLRQFDANAFPEIIPALIEVLQNDSKPAVRAEAAQSLGKLRPITQPAGWALEQSLTNDSSSRVRWQARTALWHYQLNGYQTTKIEGPAPGTITTQEPPLAPPHVTASSPATKAIPRPVSKSSRVTPSSRPAEPMPARQVSRPLTPSQPDLTPVQPPMFQTPPAMGEQGPALIAPK